MSTLHPVIRRLFALWLCCLLLGLILSGCAATPTPSHNAQGGYIEACGDLPGMLGDDC
jgi:hypothetical protein